MSRHRFELGIPTTREALDAHFRVGGLKKLAALLCTDVPSRKAELVSFVASHLSGERVRSVWARLDELQQAAVAEALHAPDRRFEAERFGAKYGRDPDWGSTNDYDRSAQPSLLRLFLYGPGLVPEDLAKQLEAFVSEPAEAQLDTLAEPPDAFEPRPRWRDAAPADPVPLTVRETERAAQRELGTVLRLVESGKIAVSERTRRPGAAAIRALDAALEGGDFYPSGDADPIRGFAWPLLVQAAGFARPEGARLVLTKPGRTALADPPAQALRTAWSRWLGTTLLDELSRIDCIKGQSGRGRRALTAVAGRRDAIADALTDCPSGRWVATDELLRHMQAAGHDFEVARDAWHLYIADPHYGSLGYDGYGGWPILQARYALCLLFEYAATLGLIDVAYVPPAGARPDYADLWGTDDLEFLSRYDGLVYLRLTRLGSYCLGLSDEYSPPPLAKQPALRVLDNLDVVAMDDELSFGDRLVLERYAEPVSPRVWRLRPATLLGALEAGGSMDELRELLVARSEDPLPGAATQLLEDAAERAAGLEDRGEARLIACADPSLAALIANDARTRRHCLAAGHGHLVVPAQSARAFSRALRKVGYAVPSQDGLERAA